jgi:hypothetical protein
MRAVGERWYLVEPLLFSVWTTHDVVLEPRIQTIRVGHGRIEYHPDFIQGLNPRQLETVMRCEAVRILLKHPYQRRKPNAILAYQASNLTLQEHLQTDLPWPRAHDLFGSDLYDRQSFDFYYQLLQDQPAQGAELLENYGEAQQVGGENSQAWDADDLFGERIDQQVVAARDSQGWGTVSGKLREQVLANLSPRLDYRAILAQFRCSILSTRRRLTRLKPSRRYGFESLGSRYDFTTQLLVAVDVSGSISSHDLAHAFSVLHPFFRYGIRAIDVICFDTQIQGKPMLLTRARTRIQVTGRGGTDLSVPLNYVDEHRHYDGLIVVSDGHAPVPNRPRNRHTRVLWIFNSEDSYRKRSHGLRPIGPSLYFKPSRA